MANDGLHEFSRSGELTGGGRNFRMFFQPRGNSRDCKERNEQSQFCLLPGVHGSIRCWPQHGSDIRSDKEQNGVWKREGFFDASARKLFVQSLVGPALDAAPSEAGKN